MVSVGRRNAPARCINIVSGQTTASSWLKIAASEAEIEKAVDAAMENVRAVAVEVAAAALERLTGKAAPEKDLAKAVDRALETEK